MEKTVPQSFSLAPSQVEELALLSRTGRFGNASEIVRQAIDAFFASQAKETRLRMAMAAYERDRVTISRAAEIAGLGVFDMKHHLRDENLLRATSLKGVFTADELAQREKSLDRRLKKKK